MPFAIVALFDASTEAGLQALRTRLAGGSDPASEAPARPHLTLAILPEVDAEALREPLRAWCRATPPLTLDIAAVGTFPTSEGVVYLAPVVTTALLMMNTSLHALLAEAGLQGVEAYRPEHWVPHVTVAIQLTPDAVADAVRLAREADVFHTGQVTQVALVEYPPMRIAYSFPLRGEGATAARHGG